ncbi:MAG TPA: DUF4177 domain-containing protein [Chitinophagales bacterium]|nr:DUF4177 domain-containing protein [Chitinophagales bacterium]
MKNYEYKCIPVPTIIDTGKTGKNMHENAVLAYEKIINNVAKDGWELVNIDTVSSLQNPGCLSQIIGIFTGGAKAEVETFKVLTFKKLSNILASNNDFQPQNIVSSTSNQQFNSTCSKCNSQTKPQDVFCENCGNKLK